MCAINGKCGCSGSAGSFVLALVGQSLWQLVKLLARIAQLLFVGLLALTVWAIPRVYRLSRRGVGAVRRWYVTRPVLVDREPVAAVTATTTAPTLADLRLTKKEANA